MDAKDRLFADIAVRLQLLTREQVTACLERAPDKRFGEAAIELGFISSDEAALVTLQAERALVRKPPPAPPRGAPGSVHVAEERTAPRAEASPRAEAGPRPRKRGARAWEAPEAVEHGQIHVPRTAAAPPPAAPGPLAPIVPTLSMPAAPMELADTAPGAVPDDEAARVAPAARPMHFADTAPLTGVEPASPPAHAAPVQPRAPHAATDGDPFEGFPLARGDEAAHVVLSEPPPVAQHPPSPVPSPAAPARAPSPALAPAPTQAHAPSPAQARPAAHAPPPAATPSPQRGRAAVEDTQPAIPTPPPPKAAAQRPAAALAPQDSYLGKALALALRHGASDLHVHSGAPLLVRIDGQLRPLSGTNAISTEAAEKIIAEITSDTQWALLARKGEVDFACELPGLARFRANVYRQQRGLDAVFRIIPLRPPTLEQLGLPSRLARLTDFRTGMVLCTGPAGCGKSTTLAALLNTLVQTRADHILTIEDPVEYVFDGGRALVNQRQIGDHTSSFARALRAALREDPDIIAITELRDRETIALAISAAETGHLVLGTLHTGNAAQTIHRMVSSFPADEQEQVRVMLAESLRAVVSQRLLPMAVGRGRVPAIELLMVNTAVSNLIREDKTHQLPSVMQTGKAAGMVTLDDSLQELINAGIVHAAAARRVAVKKERFG